MTYLQNRRSRAGTSIDVALVILLLATLCVVAGEERERATATAWEILEPVTIDGDLEEWNTSSPLILDSQAQLVRDGDYWAGPQDLSAEVYVMWDEENLYLAAVVIEDTPFRAAEMLPFDSQDSFELYFSTNPQADLSRASYESTDFHIYLLIDNEYWDTAIDRTMVADPKHLYSKGMTGGQNVLEDFQSAVQRTTLGFVYEAAIPWTNFANEEIPLFVPQAGDMIGFNFLVNDTPYPCPGTEYVPQIAWTGDEKLLTNPSEWGVLIFE